jgi:hypothetical protein
MGHSESTLAASAVPRGPFKSLKFGHDRAERYEAPANKPIVKGDTF